MGWVVVEFRESIPPVRIKFSRDVLPSTHLWHATCLAVVIVARQSMVTPTLDVACTQVIPKWVVVQEQFLG